MPNFDLYSMYPDDMDEKYTDEQDTESDAFWEMVTEHSRLECTEAGLL